MFVRCVLLFALVAASVNFPSRISAAPPPSSELCPAYSDVIKQLTPRLFSFSIAAWTPRSVRGTLVAQTDKGWFRVPFGPLTLAPTTVHFADSRGNVRAFTEATAPVQYVDFGVPVTLNMWYVEHAAADTAWWSGKGLYLCRPMSVVGMPASLTTDDVKPYLQKPNGQAILAAEPVPPVMKLNCAHPFVDAKVTSLVQPQVSVPRGTQAVTTLVRVTIGEDGQLRDTRLFKSSGVKRFDAAAIAAAKQSSYTSRIDRCRPTASTYIMSYTFANP